MKKIFSKKTFAFMLALVIILSSVMTGATIFANGKFVQTVFILDKCTLQKLDYTMLIKHIIIIIILQNTEPYLPYCKAHQ